MAKETSKQSEEERRKQYRKQAVLKSLGELEADDIEEIVIGGEQELANREAIESGGITHITEIEDKIEESFKTWGRVSGISTGYPSLDAKIGGLKPGELILIGGETNNGKSALAQNIAVNVAKEHGVLFITLEMLMTEAGSRIRYMNGGKVDNLDLMFQAQHQIDYRHIDALFRNSIEVGAKLVVLDYLQYLGRGMTLDEVARMSKLMKSLALKYEIPFIVIVSLRKSDGGKFKRKWTDIEVEDLMGTSAIGYDADVALIASRKNLDNQFETDRFFVKVVKARNMDVDYNDRYLSFAWEKTRITELDHSWVPNEEGGLPYKD
jgi:replicative DNA helicase